MSWKRYPQLGAEDAGANPEADAELCENAPSATVKVSVADNEGNNCGKHDVSVSDNPCYNIGRATYEVDEAVYYSASSPNPSSYSQVGSGQISQQPFISKQAVHLGHEYSVVESTAASKNESEMKQCCSLHPCLVILFIVMVAAIVAMLVALIVAFVLIAGLNSDVESLPSSSSSVSSLSVLRNDFQFLFNKASRDLLALQEKVDMRLDQIEDQIRNLSRTSGRLSVLEVELINKISEVDANSSRRLEEQSMQNTSLMDYISHNIMNVSSIALGSVTSLTSKLVSDIQALHVFDSCAPIGNLALPFPSGMYWVNSSDESPVQVYCSTSISLSCNSKTGGWRRVAYLNTSDSDSVECPSGLQAVNNPRSCRIMGPGGRCASVTFSTPDNPYSCIYGRVNALPVRTLDGFQGFSNTLNARPSNPSLEDNYVDGVSLTYGSARRHIWTFVAILSDSCTLCSSGIPTFVGNEYSCEIYACSDSSFCSGVVLWNGSSPEQCIGNATFNRQLSEPTTEDIEMRVCRDEDRNNEDILITVTEIFVF